ncbi:hypothetical protein U1Q18_044872 [Sarracenia purpurea var. burkii]
MKVDPKSNADEVGAEEDDGSLGVSDSVDFEISEGPTEGNGKEVVDEHDGINPVVLKIEQVRNKADDKTLAAMISIVETDREIVVPGTEIETNSEEDEVCSGSKIEVDSHCLKSIVGNMVNVEDPIRIYGDKRKQVEEKLRSVERRQGVFEFDSTKFWSSAQTGGGRAERDKTWADIVCSKSGSKENGSRDSEVGQRLGKPSWTDNAGNRCKINSLNQLRSRRLTSNCDRAGHNFSDDEPTNVQEETMVNKHREILRDGTNPTSCISDSSTSKEWIKVRKKKNRQFGQHKMKNQDGHKVSDDKKNNDKNREDKRWEKVGSTRDQHMDKLTENIEVGQNNLSSISSFHPSCEGGNVRHGAKSKEGWG